MPVFIDEVSTEVSVEPGASAPRGSGDASAAAPETQIEDLRATIREILLEEIERYMRTALPQR